MAPHAESVAPASSGDTLEHPAADIEEIRRREPRNLAAIALFFVLTRVGWIFKIESVMIPAFLDAIAGPAWVRGVLPVFNRFGQTFSGAVCADFVQHTPRKRTLVAVCSLTGGLLMASVGLMWSLGGRQRQDWMPVVFLLIYVSFFTVHGVTNLAVYTLQGKLIRPERRGRLIALSDPIGVTAALLFAPPLMSDWLARPGGGFDRIFLFAGGAFAAAALAMTLVREPRDLGSASLVRRRGWNLAETVLVLQRDRAFRRLAVIVGLVSSMQMLFPHYQALGRDRLGVAPTGLMTWAVAQNLGTGVFSLAVGPIADRFGNRFTLRLALLGAAISPAFALAIANAGAWGATCFPAVFFSMGMAPLVFKTLTNYTLEVAPTGRSARYLASMQICMAVPFLLSPLVGAAIDALGYEPVFLAGSAILLLASVGTFRLDEPRFRRVASDQLTASGDGGSP